MNNYDKDFMGYDKINKDWKKYWREQEKNPKLRRELRMEKAAAKRRINKKYRRNIRSWLKNI